MDCSAVRRSPAMTGAWMTRDNLKLLDELWPTTSTSVLAKRFGTSKSALIGKAHRMGLEPKPSPITRWSDPFLPTPPPRDRPVSKPVGPTLPVLASLQSPINAPAIRASRTLPVEPCCWVTTVGGRGKPWLYCDTDSVPGKPYCVDHQRDAHVINKKPAEALAIGGEA